MVAPSPIRISRKLIERIKLSPKRKYELAQEAQINRATLSRMLGGYETIKPNDPRVIRLGAILGLKPSQAFEKPQEAK